MADPNVTATLLKTKWYEESPGVTSSKRVGGAVIIAIGAIMKLYLFFMVIHAQVADAQTANSISDGVLYAGTALWLGTIADVFKKVPQ